VVDVWVTIFVAQFAQKCRIFPAFSIKRQTLAR
jgi:hypothetical protein